MEKSLNLSVLLSASPEEIYHAWLSSEEHGLFTGGKAKIDNKIGGRFTAWDGYIEGVTVELHPYSKIIQSWRTSDFPKQSPDSKLEVLLTPESGKTMLTLIHSGIPDGQAEEYRQGWLDYYFEPMKKYFLSGKTIT
jgi:activator of HSP90 ATPase